MEGILVIMRIYKNIPRLTPKELVFVLSENYMTNDNIYGQFDNVKYQLQIKSS